MFYPYFFIFVVCIRGRRIWWWSFVSSRDGGWVGRPGRPRGGDSSHNQWLMRHRAPIPAHCDLEAIDAMLGMRFVWSFVLESMLFC